MPKDEEDAKKFLFEEDDQLPFLQGADEDLVRLFQEVLHDPDIPSESRRMEEVFILLWKTKALVYKLLIVGLVEISWP